MKLTLHEAGALQLAAIAARDGYTAVISRTTHELLCAALMKLDRSVLALSRIASAAARPKPRALPPTRPRKAPHDQRDERQSGRHSARPRPRRIHG